MINLFDFKLEREGVDILKKVVKTITIKKWEEKEVQVLFDFITPLAISNWYTKDLLVVNVKPSSYHLF